MGRGLRRRDRLAVAARQDQRLADRQLVAGQPVERHDVVGRHVGGVGDLGQGLAGRDDVDRAVDRRNDELLADLEVVLRLEVIRPPDSHHRHAEVARNAGQRVARPNPVRAERLRRVGDRRVDGDRLEQRAVRQVRALGGVGDLVAGQVEPGRTGRVDRTVDADPGVVAIAAVLEAGNREARGVTRTARSPDRSGRRGQGDRAHRTDEDEEGDSDREEALAPGEAGPERRAAGRGQAQPEREALTRRQPMRAVADHRWRGCGAESVDPRDDRSAEQHGSRAERAGCGERRRGAVGPEAPEGVTSPDRRVLQYGLLGERTGFA